MFIWNKKNVSNLQRLSIPGIGKHHYYLNENMPTPYGANHLHHLDSILSILPILEYKIQRTLHYMFVSVESAMLSYASSFYN